MKPTLCIKNSNLLDGEISISGFRHASNLLLAASVILKDTQVTLSNVPMLKDTEVMLEILSHMGAKLTVSDEQIIIESENAVGNSLPNYLTKKLHGSIYLMPAVLARYGQVLFGASGGCQIGCKNENFARPENHVLDVMSKFGAKCKKSPDGFNKIIVEKVSPCDIDMMDYSYTIEKVTGPLTSGATKTALLMAMAVKEGTTTIRNPFLKSEVLDLIMFMRAAGYSVEHKNNAIEIQYKCHQKTINFSCVSDPSEIITYIGLAVYHNIRLKLTNITGAKIFPILSPEFNLLQKMNVKFNYKDSELIIEKSSTLNKVHIDITVTGVCTDQHPFFVLMMLKQAGGSLTENVWHERFNYIRELAKFNIDIKRQYNSIKVEPVMPGVCSAVVNGHDLRAAAMLIILSIAAPSITRIQNFEHVFRGYVDFLENLKKLGLSYTIEEQVFSLESV